MNADNSLRQLFNGEWEEQCDRELNSTIEGHGDKHTASCDGVSQEGVDGEGNEDCDLATGEEGSHVESS